MAKFIVDIEEVNEGGGCWGAVKAILGLAFLLILVAAMMK